jgi:hypothetical protein
MELGPSNTEPPGEDPSVDEAEPMDTNFKTSSMDEAEAMEIDEAPLSQDCMTSTSTGLTEECYPRTAHRRDASLGEPSLSS